MKERSQSKAISSVEFSEWARLSGLPTSDLVVEILILRNQLQDQQWLTERWKKKAQNWELNAWITLTTMGILVALSLVYLLIGP